MVGPIVGDAAAVGRARRRPRRHAATSSRSTSSRAPPPVTSSVEGPTRLRRRSLGGRAEYAEAPVPHPPPGGAAGERRAVQRDRARELAERVRRRRERRTVATARCTRATRGSASARRRSGSTGFPRAWTVGVLRRGATADRTRPRAVRRRCIIPAIRASFDIFTQAGRGSRSGRVATAASTRSAASPCSEWSPPAARSRRCAWSRYLNAFHPLERGLRRVPPVGVGGRAPRGPRKACCRWGCAPRSAPTLRPR